MFEDRRTLHTPGVYDSVLLRIRSLSPDSVRVWGTMPVGGMLCHLDDAFTRLLQRNGAQAGAPHSVLQQPLATRSVAWTGRILLRPLALHTPLRWARNMPTVAEVDQRRGGTPPSTFQHDQARLIGSLRRFVEQTDWSGHPHPFMGPLTHWEWMRWAWLHTDHHLRQFSA